MALRAVLLDALGTLVELAPPGPRLRGLLGGAGFEVSEERAVAGFRAEIEYYLAHHLEGSDPEALDELRDRCAGVLRAALGVDGLDHATARRAMLGALEFRAYPDVTPALEKLRGRGLALVIASNWDCSLPAWLAPLGLTELVDAVVTSAEVGAAKPDRRLFEHALGAAGASAGEALHVGDSPAKDLEGARAAGIRAVLIAREPAAAGGNEAIGSLAELPALI